MINPLRGWIERLANDKPELVISAKKYSFSLAAITLPTFADMANLAQQLTMILGFLVFCLRAKDDLKRIFMGIIGLWRALKQLFSRSK